MPLLQSWRWYGPLDPVSLQDIRQAGATGVVSALHHIPHGAVWPLQEIQQRKALIEAAGLSWVVVESLPVHEAIKTRSAACELYLENYRQSLRNLAACGLGTVCYNFMPVLDWTRTQLDHTLENGAKALRFDWAYLALFDIFLLKRKGAAEDYPEAIVRKAEEIHASMSEEEMGALSEIILMGVPTEGGVSLVELAGSIEIYQNIGPDGLRQNLLYFLQSIMEVCEETGINMTLHPDDPPYPILGLPRIAGSKEDLLYILNKLDHPANGICFCTGSLGVGSHNDPLDILKAVGPRVYFAHLRNVRKDQWGNFYEADHLGGDVDMWGVMKELIALNQNRQKPIPFRPDHGHQLLDDLHKVSNPGYSAIGRLKGLAELRGLEMGIERSFYT